MGIHRDGASLGLSIFDTEIRRRLFWQLILIDSRSAQLSGTGLSTMAHLWDTKLPLNVNDSDLAPEMREVPVEHQGITEMVFCLIRYEFGSFLRGIPTAGFDGDWQKLSSNHTPLSEKDKMLDQLESYLENKFARYCDPLIPLHIFSTTLIRAAICKMWLVAHHPQQYPDRGLHMSQEEKTMLFATSLRMIEYDNMGQTMQSLKRYLWHVNVHFQFDAFVYMLSELRLRIFGELVNRAWRQVQLVYEHHPELLNHTRNELYVAIGNLTIKAWAARELGLAQLSQAPPEVPKFISTLRQQGRINGGIRSSSQVASQYTPVPNQNNTSTNSYRSPYGQATDYPMNQGTPMGMFSPAGNPNLEFDPAAMDMSPVDWDYWNGLLQENESQNIDSNGQKLFG
jgi:hypothetical protein